MRVHRFSWEHKKRCNNEIVVVFMLFDNLTGHLIEINNLIHPVNLIPHYKPYWGSFLSAGGVLEESP